MPESDCVGSEQHDNPETGERPYLIIYSKGVRKPDRPLLVLGVPLASQGRGASDFQIIGPTARGGVAKLDQFRALSTERLDMSTQKSQATSLAG